MGPIVWYTLSESDAQHINNARDAQSAPGNRATANDVYPAVIVRQWTAQTANLQVLLDGPDTVWLTSRPYGTGAGTWSDLAPAVGQ